MFGLSQREREEQRKEQAERAEREARWAEFDKNMEEANRNLAERAKMREAGEIYIPIGFPKDYYAAFEEFCRVGDTVKLSLSCDHEGAEQEWHVGFTIGSKTKN